MLNVVFKLLMILPFWVILGMDLCAQEYKNSPFFVIGAYEIDGRHNANGLDISSNLPDALNMGGGYEFFINNEISVLTGFQVALSRFQAEKREDFEAKALMEITTIAYSWTCSPRYYLYVDDVTSFFVGLLPRLESTSSRGRFKYIDAPDSETPGEHSAFQFRFGAELGIRGQLFDGIDNSISIGVIGRNYGASVNKLDLQKSGYFINESLQSSASLELKIGFFL